MLTFKSFFDKIKANVMSMEKAKKIIFSKTILKNVFS